MLLLLVSTIENITLALGIMVQGMLGIFIFMAVFYLLIYALEHLFRPKEKP
ncbi:MAG: hypothetical protein QM209_00035 [Candidatus Cloacimonadota bacterium]|jgi:hypothetical protein|nr:hypothetical protein [Candidatus Cloacimonadota bacterium]OQC72529.1 MAG: hypothetical protein BWX46_00278 [Candidatus Cloacimonetes bacterium ADurb.Bin003]HNZ88723.1 hypothetical protein [Candidatus Cloacimonas acidaminovorans]HOI02182.1 hypothetical protein [Candidatus Cloacimonas acidaminovorans]HPI42685.1 hypothetical protein [Candidatus Cloacimonas acidaminovorans]